MVVRVLPGSRRLIGALLAIGIGVQLSSGSPCLAAGSAGEWQNLAGPQGLRSACAAYDAARDRVIFASSTQGYIEIDPGVWTLSTLEASTWNEIEAQPWPAGSGTGSIVFDPVRERLLLFGGDGIGDVPSSDTWELSLANPTGWKLLQTSTPTRPPGRSLPAAIHDPVGDRMIVFGGYGDSNALQDTWALSLSGSVEWQLLSETSLPSTRYLAAVVHDPVRNRMIVYGGVTSANTIHWDDRVWALTLSGAPAWSQLASGGPGSRHSSAAVYDSDQDRLLVFGGRRALGQYENDVWSLPLSGGPWTQLSIGGAAPVPRAAACAFDAAHDRLLLHGGAGQTGTLADSWSLELAGTPTWTQLSDPLPRSGATAVLDEPRARMIVFGGADPYTTALKDDLWAYSFASDAWQAIDAGAGPSARTDHAAFYDPVRDRTWLFGGFGPTYQNDLWSLAPSGEGLAWAPVDAGPAPEPRAAHTVVYDVRRDRALLFGGRGGSGRYNDVWELRLSGSPTWSQLEPSGAPPMSRYDHSAIYDPNGDRMIVFAGMGVSDLQDVWALELTNGPRWTQLGTGYVRPFARFGHTAILDPVQNRMVIFGGYYDEALWELSLLGPATWTQMEPAGVAEGASQHAAIYDPSGDRMLVLGSAFQALQWSREHLAEAPRPAAGLVLHGVRPNPIRAGRGTVSLTLPDAAPARLELIDVAGRVLHAQEVGHLGAGRHDVALRSRSLAPGVLWLRLTRAGRSIASKIVVTR